MVPVELIVILVVMMTTMTILYAVHEKRRIEHESKERLDLKLQIIELEKAIGDERRRAEGAEHELRTGNSPTNQLIRVLSELEDQVDPGPPLVYLNGQLLLEGVDYLPESHTLEGNGLHFEFALRARDVIQMVRGNQRRSLTLDHNVAVGELVGVPALNELSRQALQESMAKVMVEPEPEPEPEPERTSRYDRLIRDDEGAL